MLATRAAPGPPLPSLSTQMTDPLQFSGGQSMWHPETAPRVAILNADPAVLARLEAVFQQAGFRTLTALLADFPTEEALLAFLDEAGVRVVVYDIAPPYEAGWVAYQRFHLAAQTRALLVVVTSASQAALKAPTGMAGSPEMDGSDGSLEYTVRAVQQLLAAQVGSSE